MVHDATISQFRADDVSSMRRVQALLTICVCIVLSMSTWFSTAAVVPQLRVIWQISDSMASWLTITVQLGFVSGALIMAITGLADRYPPPVLMAISAAGAAFTNLCLLWVGGAEGAIGFRFLTGILMAGIYPPSLKLVASWYLKGRGLALGVTIGALTLGSAVPHLINASSGLQWQHIVVATSVATLLGGVGIALLVRMGPYPFSSSDFRISSLRTALLNRSYVLITAGYLGHMWELYAAWSWMLILVRARLEQHVERPHSAALITFLVIAAGAPACVIAGYIAGRFGPIPTTILFMAISGTAAVLVGFSFHLPFWVFVFVALLWGASVIGDSAQFSALVTTTIDRSLIGTALTVQLGLGFMLTSVTIWLVPWIAARVGWQWAPLCLVPGPALGIAAMVVLRRPGGRDPFSRPTPSTNP